MGGHFEYQPLATPYHFRLAYIERSLTRWTAIHCTLTEYDPNTAPPYVALSYTWGDPIVDRGEPSGLETIFVNEKPFRIRANLFHALEVLRDRETRLWVDTICIDQQNNQERGVQVALMGGIFSRASKVCAWLGPATEDSDRAMGFISRVNSGWIIKQVDKHLPSACAKWHVGRVAFAKLLERSWFSRAWIIQEVALAKDVLFMCGYKTSTIAACERASHLLLDEKATVDYYVLEYGRLSDPLQAIVDIRRRILRGDRISVLASLQMTRHTRATDPRDHLFAKMAISNNKLRDLCPPNYDISEVEVWRIFFQEYLRQKRDLYIICLAGTKPAQYSHLPSWLPTWSEVSPVYHPLCNFHEDNRPEWPHFDAAKGTMPDVSFTHIRRYISCVGSEIDKVDGIGDGFTYSRWILKLSRGTQSTANHNAYKIPDGGFQALVRTTCADTNNWGMPSKLPQNFKLEFANRFSDHELRITTDKPPVDYYWKVMQDLKFGGTTLRDLVGSQWKRLTHGKRASKEVRQAFERSFKYTMFERRLFTTLRGFLGVGPSTVASRDRIVILKGCRVPVVMRQKGQYWELIGECYVDGIMYGEALDGSLCDDQEPTWKTFDII
ncbi:40S ribosomal protein S30 [Hypoxylon texense]